MQVYASEYDNKYPTADRWCDLLLQYGRAHEELYVCKGAFKKGNKKPCHYAMNPNCEANSPPDMVLLFETKGGWNQHGGPELLTFENHKGKGCNILFNDLHVEFVNTERLGRLKWKAEDYEGTGPGAEEAF
jgi:prepilin-type processing-associated H-X9-DG protein